MQSTYLKSTSRCLRFRSTHTYTWACHTNCNHHSRCSLDVACFLVSKLRQMKQILNRHSTNRSFNARNPKSEKTLTLILYIPADEDWCHASRWNPRAGYRCRTRGRGGSPARRWRKTKSDQMCGRRAIGRCVPTRRNDKSLTGSRIWRPLATWASTVNPLYVEVSSDSLLLVLNWIFFVKSDADPWISSKCDSCL
jgi:hypothetical protein